MPWPLPSDFSAALQNPKIGLKDPALRSLAIERTKRGQPRPWSGAFAVVFKGTQPSGQSMALRAFTTEVPGQRERYHAIGAYLRTRRLSCLVRFDFQTEGIRSLSNGAWYPLLLMDWVDGLTLFDWVKEKAERRDAAAFAGLAPKWVALVAELTAAGIAHGDLQHANVMVTPAGALQLVDYDCMAVPALYGQVNTEIGVHPYQHPLRDSHTRLSPDLDRFSATFILLVIKALAADATLWARYIRRPDDVDEYDKLLIRGEDLDEPGRSPLIRELLNGRDPEVRSLTEALLESRRGPLEKVPPLGEAMASFGRLEELLKVKDFDGLVEAAATMPSARIAQMPPALARAVAEARERVAARQTIDAALARGDEEAASRLYQPRLFDGYPAAATTARAAEQAAEMAKRLRPLDAALAAHNGREAVRLWDASRDRLAERPSGQARQAVVETWRERIRLADAVAAQMRAKEPDGATLAADWQKLESLGGHPDVASLRPRVVHAIQRHAAWTAYRAAPRDASESADRALVAAWHESLFSGWPAAEAERPRVAEARRRLDLLRHAPSIDRSGPPTVAAEYALQRFVEKLPAGYSPPLAERAELAKKRLGGLAALRQVLAARPESDTAIARAWQGLDATGGTPLADREERARAEVAIKRLPILETLRGLPANGYQRPRTLLKVWDNHLLSDCPEAQAWQAEHALALKRHKALKAVRAQLNRGMELTAYRMLSDPLLRGQPLPPGWDERIRQIQPAAEEAGGLLDAMTADDFAAFTDVFSARILRRYSHEFADHAKTISRWTATVARSPDAMPRPLTFGRPGLMAAPGGGLEARWGWPDARFTQKCRLAVCRADPETCEAGAVLWEAAVSHGDYEHAGGRIVLHPQPDWAGAAVAVFSVIDVGAGVWHSRPLVLGTIASPRVGAVKQA